MSNIDSNNATYHYTTAAASTRCDATNNKSNNINNLIIKDDISDRNNITNSYDDWKHKFTHNCDVLVAADVLYTMVGFVK